MSSSPERNDRRPSQDRGRASGWKGRRGRPAGDVAAWLWGRHAVLAALANPLRSAPIRLLATVERARELPVGTSGLRTEILPPAEIARALPPGAAHQGLALKTPPLEPSDIDAVATPAGGLILVLDQVTDPQNVGAIFRSAAAFGARAIVLQERHAPPLAGALAKAAAGAIERVPHVRAVNLSRALDALADRGWRAIGLDAEAPASLAETLDARPTALVLGSEGEGLRRLVAEHCDALARIPMAGGFESLNVAAAAAVALYEAARPR
ncbi:MAG TPA: RNA methyltransferase [Caulobacteraceae bacterium]|nr:RNA methyltransferase [Caulobacteraceae bacterium]